MWNGAFLKHRDYKHSSFYEHLKDHGVNPQWLEKNGQVAVVAVRRDPVTGQPFSPPRPYHVLILKYDGNDYRYLIPAPLTSDAEQIIKRQIELYVANPVPGGRKIEDYVVDSTILE